MTKKHLVRNHKKPNNSTLFVVSQAQLRSDLFLRIVADIIPTPYFPGEHTERKDGYPSPDDDFDRDEERDIPLRERDAAA